MSWIDLTIRWTPRSLDLEAEAVRTPANLTLVSSLDPALRHWYLQGRRKGATPLDIGNVAVLANLLSAGDNRRDDNRKPIPQLGYRLTIWNGVAKGSAAVATFLVGLMDTRCGTNQALLEWEVRPADVSEAVKRVRSKIPDLGQIWNASYVDVSIA